MSNVALCNRKILL